MYLGAIISCVCVCVCSLPSPVPSPMLLSRQLDVLIGNAWDSAIALRLYRNDGSNTFTLVTGTSLSQSPRITSGLAFGDFDSDGDVRKSPASREP